MVSAEVEDDDDSLPPVLTTATAVHRSLLRLLCVCFDVYRLLLGTVFGHRHYTGNVDITAPTLAACATAELTAQLSAAAAV